MLFICPDMSYQWSIIDNHCTVAIRSRYNDQSYACIWIPHHYITLQTHTLLPSAVSWIRSTRLQISFMNSTEASHLLHRKFQTISKPVNYNFANLFLTWRIPIAHQSSVQTIRVPGQHWSIPAKLSQTSRSFVYRLDLSIGTSMKFLCSGTLDRFSRVFTALGSFACPSRSLSVWRWSFTSVSREEEMDRSWNRIKLGNPIKIQRIFQRPTIGQRIHFIIGT